MTRALALCFLLATALPGGAAEMGAFRYSRNVERGDAPQECILALELDSAVYSGTRDGFPDLRIFEGDAEVPYVIEKLTEPQTQTVRRPCASRTASLHEGDDSLELIVTVEADSPNIDSLAIRTPLKNFERRVSISGSKDGTAWTPLVPGALIFDYSRYMDIANHEIGLPKNDFRQFKIAISGIADEKESPFLELTRRRAGGVEAERTERTMLERRPFRIDRIELWHEAVEKILDRDKRAAYAPRDFRVEEDPQTKSTIIYVRTRREPLTQFTVETSSRNFNRAATVQRPMTRGDRTLWLDAGAASLSVVDFGGYHKESLTLSMPEMRETEYRIVIRNDDNPPLKITGVKADGNVYRAVFLAAKDAQYRLCYGSEEVKQPKYDAAAVLLPLRQGQAAVEGRLGAELVNATAGEPSTDALRSFLNNRLMLGGVTALLVAALGWALFRAAQRINELPKE